jgi:hypothetical protein
MTPHEVDQLDDAMYVAMVRFMEREAREIQKAAKRR